MNQLTTLTGTLKIKPIERQDKNGNRYYFTFLLTEEEEKALFFFNPPFDLMMQVERLQEGEQITVEGTNGNLNSLRVNKIIETKYQEELESSKLV